MFGIILLSIATLINLYVIWRVTTVPALTGVIPRSWIWPAGFFLWLLLVVGRTYGHEHQTLLAVTFEYIGMIWLAALFLLFVCLLAVDLVTLFGFLFPKLAPRLRGLALLAGMTLTVIGLVQGHRPPVVVNHEVKMPGLPAELDGLVVVVMADLHLGSQRGRDWLQDRVDQVNALKPDIIFLVGDIFEGHGRGWDGLTSTMRQLKAPLGILAVLGNHEFHGGGGQGQRLLADSGSEVLRNRWVQVGPGLIIAGVDDLTTRRRRGLDNDDYIGRALAGRPKGATILLSHSPLDLDKAEARGVGLMLSGHTHGGQIWPFGYVVGLVYPVVAGLEQLGDMTIIVCRGTGHWGPTVRLWHPGEILRIVLKAESEV